MPSSSHLVELAEDDPAMIATSRQPALLSYLSHVPATEERWLRESSIAINVSKSIAMLVKAGRCIPTSRLVYLFGGQIHWVNTARFRGVTLETRLTWSSPIEQVRKKAAQRLGVLGPLLNRKSGLSVRNGVLLYKQLILRMMDHACPIMKSAARTS